MRRPPRPVLISALIGGAMIILHQPIRSHTLTILRLPFTIVRSMAAVLVSAPHLPALANENAQLRTEAVQRQLELAQLREALRQAQQAHALFEARPSPDGVVATIMSRSILPTQHTVLLNHGTREGLTLESVIVDAGGVVGRVIELHASSALVMLLTDPESRVAGVVERSRESGLLIGDGTGSCQFIYLDAQADVQEGDRIATAGLGASMPKGLLLGTVQRVFRDEAAGTARAMVIPAARLGQVEEVLCLPSAAAEDSVSSRSAKIASPPEVKKWIKDIPRVSPGRENDAR